ncbi:lytic murein transglycosylase [Phyllobacterium myrsinacearum]|uniref:Lytic murein transglycosylase n=1 Tax=Phyllobacterium myrsinacearum TaxID=28101 RepID=A0A2S9JZD4_9HYPH|nr:lytic murein transglycosylase [Phyllobacterium myrsinacearum]
MRSGFTPLCPAGHLPHKGGDRPALPFLRNLKRFLLCENIHANVISPLVGEMSGRTEGGA